MGKIIAVVSGKGGTGKTSFTANVGLALAALGCHTLCLDCDITLRNLDLALGLSDRALMVTNTDASSLRDAQRTGMERDRLGRGNLHLVVGRVEKKLLRSLHTTIDDAMDAAGLPLLGVVPEDRNVPYALNTGIPLRECSNYAARAYENIARRIMGQRIPLMRI